MTAVPGVLKNRKDERGAVIIFTAIFLIVMVASAAMGVDIARQVSKKRSVEEIADLAAHDASYAFRPIEANMATVDYPNWFEQFAPTAPADDFYQLAVIMAKNSMVRNSFLQQTATLSCSGTVETIKDIVGDDYATVEIFVPDSNGVNQAVQCTDPPGGVLSTSQGKMVTIRVTAHTLLQYDFLPGIASVNAAGTQQDRGVTGCSGSCGTGGTTTTTAGTSPSTVPQPAGAAGKGQFSIGSFLARETLNQPGVNDLSATTDTSIGNVVAFNNSFLIAGLGIPPMSLNLDVVSFQGLENASLTIESLAAVAGYAGRPDQLFAQQLTINQLLTDMQLALSMKSDSASVAALGVINTLIATSPTTTSTFSFGQLFGTNAVTTAGSAILSASINTGDLLAAAVEATIVSGSHLLTLSVPVTGISGVVSSTLKLGLIEAPQFSALGLAGTTANTTQIRAELDLTLPQPTGATGPVVLPIYVAGASANGTLTSITCAPALMNQMFAVSVSTQGVVLTVGTSADTTQLTSSTGGVTLNNATLTSVNLVGGGSVGLNGSGTATVAGTQQALPAFPVNAGEFAPAYLSDYRTAAGTTIGGQLSVAITPTGTVSSTDSATVASVSAATSTEIATVLNSATTGGTAPIDALVSSISQAIGLGLAGAQVTGYTPYCGP